jgi:membrane-bound lytic murein transglycosylase B
MWRRTLLLGGAALAVGPGAVRAAANLEGPLYAGRDDAMRFAELVAARHGLPAASVRAALGEARYQPRVAQLIMPAPAGTAPNWTTYRNRFVEPVRLRAGVEFWREHAPWLKRAQEVYGVPPEIVAGIVGVETIYGRFSGGFRAIDALATLALDFPSGRSDRSGFFRDELGNFFALCHQERLDPLALKGSYAGALGMPQFMPSSFLRYGADFDADGQVDLHNSAADVIGSVAHYLAEFGWRPGVPTHFAAAAPENPVDRARLLLPDIVPSFSATEFAAAGAWLEAAGREFGGKLALVELRNGDAAPPSHFAGTSNFYTITRYNWSSYYAMAVIELGAALRRELEAGA